MPSVLLQRMLSKFQKESSDLETQLLELGFICEKDSKVGNVTASFAYNVLGSTTSFNENEGRINASCV